MKELVAISEARLADTVSGYIRPLRSYFKALGLRADDLWAPSEYMEWIAKRQAEFFAQRAPGVAKDSWRYQSRRKGKVKC